jgi:3-deoxy-D-manno-octulosonate 8-phosphate phosphatase (KDO 8-P phosphatase)
MPSDLSIAAPIRLIISDVDGVLTDGTITYDDRGGETKSFHVRDGQGIKLWQQAGHRFAILSARRSPVVARRAEELGIDLLRQGFEDKWPAAAALIQSLGMSPHETAYIGDDLPDIAVMRQVGLAVAVSDAATDTRRAAAWTTCAAGGRGAVRELIERLLRAKEQWDDLLAMRA